MKDWVKNGFGWAVWMFVMMTFFWPLITGEKITLKSVLIGAVFWSFIGIAMGYIMTKFVNKKN
ncbi:hypothetical protein MC378_06295 [Polaribacter sp. MSW13]|uniref:Uncharacterized protein n=1 Tax=Polaribacter marinus TaxID=2916838 RepID=A0A9X1VMC3_9FLAO|nr:hypothetical protein [Polaribacter marinus]MCI2228771.1 hypothetical protein [Polaribacter marinus]